MPRFSISAAIAAALVLFLSAGTAEAQIKAYGVNTADRLQLPPVIAARPFAGTFEAYAQGDRSDIRMVLTISENAGLVAGQVNSFYTDPRIGMEGWHQASGYPQGIGGRVSNGVFSSPFGDSRSRFDAVYWCDATTICASTYSANLMRYYLLRFTPVAGRQAQR